MVQKGSGRVVGSQKGVWGPKGVKSQNVTCRKKDVEVKRSRGWELEVSQKANRGGKRCP